MQAELPALAGCAEGPKRHPVPAAAHRKECWVRVSTGSHIQDLYEKQHTAWKWLNMEVKCKVLVGDFPGWLRTEKRAHQFPKGDLRVMLSRVLKMLLP